MRNARMLVVAASLAVASAVTAVPAGANHVDSMYKTATFGPNCSRDIFCKTDNADLTVFRENTVFQWAWDQRVRPNLLGQYDPTDLRVIFSGSASYSGGSETDIIYQAGGLPPGVLGATWCDDPVSGDQCDQQYVRFGASDPGADVSCHETGHGVGLTHGSEASPQINNGDGSLACMRTPATGDAGLGGHNQSLISGTY